MKNIKMNDTEQWILGYEFKTLFCDWCGNTDKLLTNENFHEAICEDCAYEIAKEWAIEDGKDYQ